MKRFVSVFCWFVLTVTTLVVTEDQLTIDDVIFENDVVPPLENNSQIIDQSLKSSVDVLEMYSGAMDTIPCRYFADNGYANVSEIKMRKCRVSNIETDAFQGVPFLSTIDLKDNNIASLSKGIFGKLENLKELVLSDNSITEIEEGTFEDLRSLEYLNLNNNELSYIPEDIKVLDNLKYLDLSYNNFFNTDVKFVSKSLNILKISGCGINQLTEDSFKDLPELLLLDMSNNDLKYLPENLLVPLQNIIFLDINQNDFLEEYKFDFIIPKSLTKIVFTIEKHNTSIDLGKQILEGRETEIKNETNFYGLNKTVLILIEKILIGIFGASILCLIFVIFLGVCRNSFGNRYKKLKDDYIKVVV